MKNSMPDSIIDSMEKRYNINMRQIAYMLSAFALLILCAVFSSLHYKKVWVGNDITWISWVLGMICVLLAFLPHKRPAIFIAEFYIKNKKNLIFFGALTLLFFISHIWNWDTAPWNQNGLFDDAAWDIYFSENKILNGEYFQPVFPDPAAREVIFHYYLIPFFKIFGFNILVFNISLIILGYVTFIFMSLLIQRLFKNFGITFICAVIFNFLPLHFFHTFVGHRYAISAPLMLTAMYFLHTGFTRNSYFRISLSSVLTGLCVACATMGKQYLEALVGAAILLVIFSFRKSVNKGNFVRVAIFALGTIVTLTPLIMYAVFFRKQYLGIESLYIDKFMEVYKNSGFDGIMREYVTRMVECLIGETHEKWFLPDHPMIQWSYYLFLVPGLFIAFFRKQFIYPILVLLASFGAFLAGYSDYRVLHSSPFWVITMAFTMNQLLIVLNWLYGKYLEKRIPRIKLKAYRIAALCLIALIVIIGVVPDAGYIYKKSKDPFSIGHFNQDVVPVSRYIRDIVAGVPNPSAEMRRQEFKKLEGYPEPNYDTLVCQDGGYAVTHTFLYEYGDKEIMSLSGGLPARIYDSFSDLLDANKRAIAEYGKNTRDLKLIWEVSFSIKPLIDRFKQFEYLGSGERKTINYYNTTSELYILNIDNKNIDIFKEKVSKLKVR